MDRYWIQCVKCSKWRCLPSGVNPDNLPEQWFCGMEPFNRYCEMPEVDGTSIAASDDKFMASSCRDHNIGAGSSKSKEVKLEVPPMKTKLLQKSVKNKFFPKTEFDEAMEALRLSALNNNNSTRGINSTTTIVNITAGRPRPLGRPRKF